MTASKVAGRRGAESVAVLMYHAVSDRLAGAGDADPHYCVGEAAFRDHLSCLADAGFEVAHVRSVLQASGEDGRARVAFTFDDGHTSNARAAEWLAARGWSADFFVNPSTVGTRHFLSWAELRDMAADGMSIQSHGQHHRFLDELGPADVRAELAESKQEIEDHLGLPVEVYAPAGGRMAPHMDRLAEELGYRVLCTSRVGMWRPASGGRPVRWNVPRFAVLAATGVPQLMSWARGARWEITRQVLRYEALTAAKRMLGNAGYEKLRGGLLRTTKEMP